MKTYSWLNRNRFLSHLRFTTAGAVITAAAMALFATLSTPSAYAEDHQFTVLAQITNIQAGVPDANHVTFTLAGRRLSPLLGNFTVTGTAVTPLPQSDCDNTYADFTISTANGTIEIHQEDVNCYTQIVGFWWVTGGTLGASGSGTDRGTGATRSIHGRLVGDYVGTLSLN